VALIIVRTHPELTLIFTSKTINYPLKESKINMKRKWLAIGIILLFVGVSIAPTINFNTVKASQEDDLVEVTSQACGINGYKDITVKLTREQYQDLEQYLVEFKARLNQTTTREEAIPIFNDAVVELNKYGLLPRGMSVENAQKLIIGGSPRYQRINFNLKQTQVPSNVTQNMFCFVTGNVSNVLRVSFLSKLLHRNRTPCLSNFIFSILLDFLWDESSISVLNVFHFGTYDFVSGYTGYQFFPAKGSISTIGMLGVNQINGSFYGALPIRPTVYYYFNMYFGTTYTTWLPAVFGFTGFKIYSHPTIEFLGSALWVKISTDPPE
jgi:hypothetical protein